MVKLIKNTNSNYTNVSNQLVRDKRLSWKARGIFCYLWSQADNWQFYISEIVNHAPEGKESLQNGIKELEKYGYLKRLDKHSKENGKFEGKAWLLTDHTSNFTVNGETGEKAPETSVFPSDGKAVQRVSRPTDNTSLRNNNNKNYQQQEISIESNIYSPAEPNHTAQTRKAIIDYLNEKLGTNYKPNATKNKKVINARLNEGYTLDDFKRVIDNKYLDWISDPKMVKYLRPETLFGTKFDGYLNEQSTQLPKKPKRHYV